MCNGPELLKTIQDLNAKPKELRCTVNAKCWCFKLETLIEHPDYEGVCMSPAEILAIEDLELPQCDIDLLTELKDHEFIS